MFKQLRADPLIPMEFVGASKSKALFYLEHAGGEIMHHGEWQQCSTDVKIWKKQRNGTWEQRRPFAHRGKGGRYDLLCNVGGWPRDVQFARVIGWAFYAKRKMSFAEYQRKTLVKVARKKKHYEYAHQVNHIEGHPEDCCLDHLELGSAQDNKDAFAVDAPELLNTVFKRPALKRPAAAK